ncbi:MAG: 50S ribosomal protein L19 [Chlamydiae bacterium]|nr:50S ribosomal protein L19 [Chlamydiota bacterium]
MTSALIEELESAQLRSDIPEMFPGDTVRVWTRIKEGDKERVQAFEGIVVGLKGRGLSARLMVYRVAYRQAMQKNFPIHSPGIDKIEVVRRGHVRRAKLTYLIGKTGKKARVVEKMMNETAPQQKETSAREENV